jgi:hypothetical protein
MPKRKQINFEETVGDPTKLSDALVVLFKHSRGHTGVIITLSMPDKLLSLRKLNRLYKAVTTSASLTGALNGYRVVFRKVVGSTFVQAQHIVFAVETKCDKILLFLEFASQCGVTKNPILSDARKIDLS